MGCARSFRLLFVVLNKIREVRFDCAGSIKLRVDENGCGLVIVTRALVEQEEFNHSVFDRKCDLNEPAESNLIFFTNRWWKFDLNERAQSEWTPK